VTPLVGLSAVPPVVHASLPAKPAGVANLTVNFVMGGQVLAGAVHDTTTLPSRASRVGTAGVLGAMTGPFGVTSAVTADGGDIPTLLCALMVNV
jgi:hypothetical protein